MHEPAVGLLWHLESLERFAIDELARSVDGLVPWFRLERDVLAVDQVDLERVQLLAQELSQKGLVGG